jgi:hypothetical protein
LHGVAFHARRRFPCTASLSMHGVAFHARRRFPANDDVHACTLWRTCCQHYPLQVCANNFSERRGQNDLSISDWNVRRRTWNMIIFVGRKISWLRLTWTLADLQFIRNMKLSELAKPSIKDDLERLRAPMDDQPITWIEVSSAAVLLVFAGGIYLAVKVCVHCTVMRVPLGSWYFTFIHTQTR